MLNFFTFRHNLHFLKGELLFLEEFIAKYLGIQSAEERFNGDDAATLRTISGPPSQDAGPLPPQFLPSNLHWSFVMQSCVTLSFAECEIKLQPLAFT